MVFFSKNMKSAKEYAKKKKMKGQIVLSKHQVPHSSGWKTWKASSEDEAYLKKQANFKP